MAGFRKAKAEQAALKMGIYGPPGSGKTFTSLLLAEGLAAIAGKRVAYIDTEHGTDFYCQDVPTRAVHPQAFDFDALYTRSLMDANTAVRALSPDEYAVVIVDSMTHLWEAARASYAGKLTSIGTIPISGWGAVKRPYKALENYLVNSPMHFIMCGRQGTEFETNEETEEMRAVGKKMKAEGETPYEPHILIRMESIKPKKTNEVASIVAYVEKDRTGVLSGRSFINPNFDSLCKPLLPLLGVSQAQIQSTDQAAAIDAEQIAKQEADRGERSQGTLKDFCARIQLAKDERALKDIARELTPQIKSLMLVADVTALRDEYQARERQLSGSRS